MAHDSLSGSIKTKEYISLMVEKKVDQWRNPLIKHRADPWIMLHADGYYYFVATVPTYDYIELRRSKTVSGLAKVEPKIIWREHDTGDMKYHIWAPEIHYINSKWYIYFAAGHEQDPWRIRMYVLECGGKNPLEAPWVEKGQIKSRWDTFSLDATTFEHQSEQYMIWAQSDPNIAGNSNLYIDKMINPWTLSGQQVMISTPEYPWERIGFNVNEGPAVLKTDAKIYVSYSASKTDHNYCLGLLEIDTDKNLLNPKHWKKYKEPVFATSEVNQQYGPGHNCFVRKKTTDEIILVYHARSYKQIQGDPLSDPNRHTRAQVIRLDAGEIIFDQPIKDGVLCG